MLYRYITSFLAASCLFTFASPSQLLAGEPKEPLSAAHSVKGLTLPENMTVREDEGFVLVSAQCKGTAKFLVFCSDPAVQIKAAAFGDNSLVVGIPPRPGISLTVYAVTKLEDGELSDFAYTRILVAENNGPRPPPKPEPPAPKLVGKLHLSIIEDAAKRTPKIAAILTSQSIREYAAKNGHQIRVFDPRDPTHAAIIKSQGLDQVFGNQPFPVLIIQTEDGKVHPSGKALPLPASELDFLKLLQDLTGK